MMGMAAVCHDAYSDHRLPAMNINRRFPPA
jgi:hypothetical protein